MPAILKMPPLHLSRNLPDWQILKNLLPKAENTVVHRDSDYWPIEDLQSKSDAIRFPTNFFVIELIFVVPAQAVFSIQAALALPDSIVLA